MPKWEQLRNLLLLIALYSLSIPSKMIFYQDLTFREVILYFWTITQAILSFIYTKKINSKWSILWGVELMVWGWTVSTNSYYEKHTFFYYLGITPLLIYSLLVTHVILKKRIDINIANSDLELSYELRGRLFGMLAFISWGFGIFMCGINELISSRVATYQALKIQAMILIVLTFIVFMMGILNRYFKCKFSERLMFFLGGVLGVPSGYAGLGWNYAVLTGIPSAFLLYYFAMELNEKVEKRDRDKSQNLL